MYQMSQSHLNQIGSGMDDKENTMYRKLEVPEHSLCEPDMEGIQYGMCESVDYDYCTDADCKKCIFSRDNYQVWLEWYDRTYT